MAPPILAPARKPIDVMHNLQILSVLSLVLLTNNLSSESVCGAIEIISHLSAIAMKISGI